MSRFVEHLRNIVNHSGTPGKGETKKQGDQPAASREAAPENPTPPSTMPKKKKPSHSLPVFVRSDFQVGSMMGEGSFATVHKAKHLATRRDVAIKVVRPESELDIGPGPDGSSPAVSYKDVLNAMKLEVQMLELIGNHPNVIEILGAAEDCKVFVMERAASDLYSIVKHQEKHLPLQLAAQWTEQICRAVEYCHERGIVHQDIKSSNILVLSDRTAKICDFGLARKGSKTMYVDRELVTLWYRAPELLMGDSTYSVKVDEWGVGCIVLEMIIGGCPFRGKPECVCSCPQTTHRNYNSDQLMKIFAMTGTPQDKALLARMSCHQHFSRWPVFPRKIESTVNKCVTLDRCATWKAGRPKSEHDLDVIAKTFISVIGGMLQLDPDKRISCSDAIVKINPQEFHDSPSGPRSPGTDAKGPKTPTAGPTSQTSPTAAERTAAKMLNSSSDAAPAEPALPPELIRRETVKPAPIVTNVQDFTPERRSSASSVASVEDNHHVTTLKQDPRHARDGPRDYDEAAERRKSVTPTRRLSQTIVNPTAGAGAFSRAPSAPTMQPPQRKPSVSDTQHIERRGSTSSNQGEHRRSSISKRDSMDRQKMAGSTRDSLEHGAGYRHASGPSVSPPGAAGRSAANTTSPSGRYLPQTISPPTPSSSQSTLSPTHFVSQTPKGTESSSKKGFFGRTPSNPSNPMSEKPEKKENVSATSRMRSWLRRSSS